MPKHDGYSKREIETLLEQVNSLSNDKLTLSEERIRLSEHVNRLNLDLRDMRQAQVRLCMHACTWAQIQFIRRNLLPLTPAALASSKEALVVPALPA
jgi:hypothetical protein